METCGESGIGDMARKKMKEDKLNMIVDSALAFLKERQRLIIRILLVVVLVVAAFLLAGSRLKQKELLAMQIFSEGQNAFREEKFDNALSSFRKVCRDYARSKVGEQAVIYSAESLCRLGELEEAETGFREYLTRYPGGEFCAAAHEGLGYLMEQRGDYRKAIEAYRQVFEDCSGSYLAPRAMLSIGRCFEAMGMWEEAKESYKELISSYPWSSSVTLAGAYLDVVEWEIKKKER